MQEDIMTFQFALFYLPNKTVIVESTAIMLEKADELYQPTSKPDLEDDKKWIEIKCPTRKQPEKTMAAIVLLFGDSYEELSKKKGLFILGKDIWAEEESRSARRKKTTRETEVLEPKKAVQAKQVNVREAARNQVLQALKTSLSQKRRHEMSSEEESPQHVNTPKKAARRLLLPPASSPNPDDGSDDTYIESPQAHNMIQAPDFEEDVGLTSTPKTMDVNNSMDDIMASLRELPEMIKQMKECVEYVRAMMPSTSGSPSSVTSSSSFCMASDEQHALEGSIVTVSKRAFLRLNRSRMTLFCHELAALVFSKEVLATSTLTGKSGKGGPPKDQLDVAKVQAITDAVIKEFPLTSASDVRAIIRRKCNNEQFNQRRYT